MNADKTNPSSLFSIGVDLCLSAANFFSAFFSSLLWPAPLTARDRFLLCVEYLEKRSQAAHLQQILHPLRDVKQPNLAARWLQRVVARHHRAESGTVDISDTGHVEQHMFVPFARQIGHARAQRFGTFAKSQPALQAQHRHATRFRPCNFEVSHLLSRSPDWTASAHSAPPASSWHLTMK